MGWFQSLVSGGVDKVVDSVGTAIDKLVTSDEEKLQLHNELAKIKLEAELNATKMELEADAKIEEEVSKRWSADMAGDSKLAKAVRPASLLFLLGVVSIMAFADGNILAFAIKPAYIDLFQALLMLVFGAYFGSRGIEKVYQIKNK